MHTFWMISESVIVVVLEFQLALSFRLAPLYVMGAMTPAIVQKQ